MIVMKKIIIALLLVVATSPLATAQVKSDDFGRVIINAYLPSSLSLANEARNLLETKLKEMASVNGVGGSSANPRFIITANVNVATKDIIAGAPTKVSQKINVTLFVGDAVSDTVFSSMPLNLIGIGNNENQSFIDAFNSINPRDKLTKDFLAEGERKILAYYSAQCSVLAKEAETLANRQQFDEAIYKLALVPQASKGCYMKSQQSMQKIYKQKIDYDGAGLLAKAKTLWIAEPNVSGAESIRALINDINPNASCYPEIAPFVKKIQAKILADEKQHWQFEMKQYKDKVASEKRQQDAWRQIAFEFARNLPNIISYSYIIW